jgi:hypothetical protein
LKEGQANARLIAAAPDMLAVLHELDEYLDQYADIDMLVQVRAAIAKAESKN